MAGVSLQRLPFAGAFFQEVHPIPVARVRPQLDPCGVHRVQIEKHLGRERIVRFGGVRVRRLNIEHKGLHVVDVGVRRIIGFIIHVFENTARRLPETANLRCINLEGGAGRQAGGTVHEGGGDVVGIHDVIQLLQAAGAGVLTLFKALEAEERFALHGGGEQLLLILVRLPAVHEEPGVLAVYPGRQAAGLLHDAVDRAEPQRTERIAAHIAAAELQRLKRARRGDIAALARRQIAEQQLDIPFESGGQTGQSVGRHRQRHPVLGFAVEIRENRAGPVDGFAGIQTERNTDPALPLAVFMLRGLEVEKQALLLGNIPAGRHGNAIALVAALGGFRSENQRVFPIQRPASGRQGRRHVAVGGGDGREAAEIL